MDVPKKSDITYNLDNKPGLIFVQSTFSGLFLGAEIIFRGNFGGMDFSFFKFKGDFLGMNFFSEFLAHFVGRLLLYISYFRDAYY
jgi:hypothetical protein